MNNKNKILVGCLALLLVLSVGYAIFSDTITINGTATAKGSFDITATCETGISGELGTVESLGLTAEGGYENDSCSIEDDEVSLEVNFLYPGARRYFTVKMTNTGTIDATASVADITASKQMCVADNIEGENQTCTTASDHLTVLDLMGYTNNINFNVIGMEDEEGNLLTSTQISEFYDSTTGTITLKSGYSVYFYFGMWVDHSTTTEYTTNEMFVNTNYIINVPFDQTTAN